MSYDISLYEPNFLRIAISSGLGDWTVAPPLGGAIRTAVVRAADVGGFVAAPQPTGFAEFMRSQGVEPSADFKLITPQHNVELQLFKNSVVLSVRPSAVANASISFARGFGQQLAKELGLGFYDPQEGEVLVSEV